MAKQMIYAWQLTEDHDRVALGTKRLTASLRRERGVWTILTVLFCDEFQDVFDMDVKQLSTEPRRVAISSTVIDE